MANTKASNPGSTVTIKTGISKTKKKNVQTTLGFKTASAVDVCWANIEPFGKIYSYTW